MALSHLEAAVFGSISTQLLTAPRRHRLVERGVSTSAAPAACAGSRGRG